MVLEVLLGVMLGLPAGLILYWMVKKLLGLDK